MASSFIIILFFGKAFSQERIVTVGAGYGFFYNDPSLRDVARADMQTVTGPLYLRAELQTKSRWSYGITFTWFVNNWREAGEIIVTDSVWIPQEVEYHHQVKSYGITGRINYIYPVSMKFDLLAGAGTGFKINNWNIDPRKPPTYGTDADYLPENDLYYNFPLTVEFVLGVRYRLLSQVSLFCEMGYSRTAVQVGALISF